MPPLDKPFITITSFEPPSDSLVDIFETIAHKPGSLLLDTSGSSMSGGRFNIMLWDPYATVMAKHGGDVNVKLANKAPFTSELSPFEAVETYLHSQVADLTLAPALDIDAELLPFIIGVAGMAGYDTGRFYECLPNSAIDSYQTPDFSVGLYLKSLIEDTETGKFYFCSAQGHTAPPLFTSCAHLPFSLTSEWHSNLTKSEYKTRIAHIHEYLLAGDCYQVNLAQRFTASFVGSPWLAYKTLRANNQAPFSSFMQLENSSILSISPERFMRVQNGNVETKPIKGTRPRFADPHKDAQSAQALLTAEKDRAENLMIVDLLRNDLSKQCKPHSVTVPSLFALESYQAVHHLVSTVTGKLNDNITPLTLLASCFPGGSITGAPKIRAMEIIDELEIHRRNIYCGSIFYMGFREDMDSSICIRTLLAENNQLHCWAGGGIVLDSNALDEYNETLDKVSKILPILAKEFGSNREQS